jgi:hypothetical protein
LKFARPFFCKLRANATLSSGSVALPPLLRSLLGDLGPPLWAHSLRPCLAAHTPQRNGGGVLAVVRNDILNPAGGDPHDMNGIADYFGGAPLGSRGIQTTLSGVLLVGKHATISK